MEDGGGELGEKSTDVLSQHLCFPSRTSMDSYMYAGVAIETTLKNVQAFTVNKKGAIERGLTARVAPDPPSCPDYLIKRRFSNSLSTTIYVWVERLTGTLTVKCLV